DAAAMDDDPLARCGGPRLHGLFGDRDVERRDLPQAAPAAGRGRISWRDPAGFRAADGVDGALLRDQLLPVAGRADRPAREAREPGLVGAAGDAPLPAQPPLPVQHLELDLDTRAAEADRARQCDARTAVVIPALHAG